jgi:hypothetical protein
MNQNERNFWLDSILFILFLSTMVTGSILWQLIPHQITALFLGFNRDFWRSFHISSGLAMVVGSLIHIIWHRDWQKAMRKRPMASLPSKLRANQVVDRFIGIAFLAASIFGALDWIIPKGENGIGITGHLHVAFGIAWLLGIVVHLALHKQWIASASMRYLRVKEVYRAHFSNIS